MQSFDIHDHDQSWVNVIFMWENKSNANGHLIEFYFIKICFQFRWMMFIIDQSMFFADRFINKFFILILKMYFFWLLNISIVVTSDFDIISVKSKVCFDYILSIENSLFIYRRPSISIILMIIIYIELNRFKIVMSLSNQLKLSILWHFKCIQFKMLMLLFTR